MGDFSSLFIFFPAEAPVCSLPLPKNPHPGAVTSEGILGRQLCPQPSPGSLSLTQPQGSAAEQRHRWPLGARPGGETGM